MPDPRVPTGNVTGVPQVPGRAVGGAGRRTTGPVTLMDVARRAGVSLATASRALNGGERRVREDLRERVIAAAAELDYAVNTQAQAVARGWS